MKESIYYRFFLSIIRHLVSALSAFFVHKGWVDAETADEFTGAAAAQIAIGIIAFAGTLWFAYKDKIWEFVKTRVGIELPPSTPISKVAAIAATVENKSAVAKGDINPLQGVSNAR